MSDPMTEVIPYLKARLAEYSARPELNKNSIAEYNRLLTIALERPADYLKEAGDMFPVAQAEQLGRAESMILLYHKLSIDGCVRANEIVLDAAKKATGYGDLNFNIGEARNKANPFINSENERRNKLMELIGLIIKYRVCLAKEKAGYGHTIKDYWNQLKSLDPEVSWKKITTDTFYRRCLYYDEDRLSLLGQWLAEVLS